MTTLSGLMDVPTLSKKLPIISLTVEIPNPKSQVQVCGVPRQWLPLHVTWNCLFWPQKKTKCIYKDKIFEYRQGDSGERFDPWASCFAILQVPMVGILTVVMARPKTQLDYSIDWYSRKQIRFHLKASTCVSAKGSNLERCWLIDYLLFYVPLNNFPLIWRRHHCRWRAVYRATPAVISDLEFSGLIRRTTLFSRLLRHTTVCGESILTWILLRPHSVAIYDTQRDVEDLF
jgi:hypothetical protein